MKRIKDVLFVVMPILFLIVMVAAGIYITDKAEYTHSEDMRLHGVSRVLMHEPGRYTILVEVPENKKVNEYYFSRGSTCQKNFPEIFHDVPTDQAMWIQYRKWTNGRDQTCTELVAIHVHSGAEINGGGWNHGKFGRGQTTVVE